MECVLLKFRNMLGGWGRGYVFEEFKRQIYRWRGKQGDKV